MVSEASLLGVQMAPFLLPLYTVVPLVCVCVTTFLIRTAVTSGPLIAVTFTVSVSARMSPGAVPMCYAVMIFV